MAPSLLKLGAAALSYAVSAQAVAQTYQVSDTYDSTNFFSKFNFVTVRDPDPSNHSDWSRAGSGASRLPGEYVNDA